MAIISTAGSKQQAASTSCLLPPARDSRGFALLVAVIFMSVMLTLGLELGSLAYKQEVLASGSVESQYSFYVADAALECALYADQQQNLFAYPATAPSSAPQLSCGGVAPFSSSFTYTASQFSVFNRLSLDGGKRCADVSIYKPSTFGTVTYAYAQGYDAPCATVASPSTARFVARGLSAHYTTGAAVAAPTYATLNPSDTGAGVTLSNGNLSYLKIADGWGLPGGSALTSGLSRATIGESSGKWYWEVTLNSSQSSVFAGISLGTLANSYLGSDSNGWGLSFGQTLTYQYHSGGGYWYNSNPNPVGTVWGFALDMGAGTLTTYQNGVSQGLLASGLSGTVYPAFDSYYTGSSMTTNFGASSFAYAPPSGFNAIGSSGGGGGGGGTHGVAVLTSGTSWTVPSGDTSIKVWAIGGGGGGAGSTNVDAAAGSGGGAGGVAYKTYTVSGGTAVSYTTGAPGFGGVDASAGGTGGNTAVSVGGALLVGTGGAGGGYNNLLGGGGGTFSGGDGGVNGGVGQGVSGDTGGGYGGAIGGGVGTNGSAAGGTGGQSIDVSGLQAAAVSAYSWTAGGPPGGSAVGNNNMYGGYATGFGCGGGGAGWYGGNGGGGLIGGGGGGAAGYTSTSMAGGPGGPGAVVISY